MISQIRWHDHCLANESAWTEDVQTSQSGAKTNIANDIASFLFDLPSSTGRDLNTFFPAYRRESQVRLMPRRKPIGLAF